MIVGLTGPSGCGTSLAGSILAENGWLFIDCDALYHSMLNSDISLRRQLTSQFGDSILSSEGMIDRKALARIVFSSPEQLDKLNSITHPLIQEKVLSLISEAKETNVCIEAIELISSGIAALCHTVIGILADSETRIYRIMIRDALLRSDAEKRIAAQRQDSYYLAHCDLCLYNNGSIPEFRASLLDAINSL